MNYLLVVSGLACAAAALVVVAGGEDFPAGYRHNRYAFNGHYPGRCGNDGFYYKDHFSFVICSNGNSYDQPCAPGSRNSEYGRYSPGDAYLYRDFCDVNLVDVGFGAHHAPAYGYAAPRRSTAGYA